MSPLGWALAALTLLCGCSPRPAAAGPRTCAPSTAALDSSAAAAALEGAYRIRLVAGAGPRRDSSTDGTLTLEQPAGGSPVEPPRRYVLRGYGDIRLDEVGAAADDVASQDAARPGVLAFDLPAGGQGRRLLLRLGAEANRQDVMRVEGAYTVLRVREIRPDGFVGDWTSGAPLPVAEGHFCAWRADTTET